MTDEKLYALCKQYGSRALEARRKFIGLLPEVYKRHLYTKKGFGSILEFAAKLAGVSEEQVRLVLRLERKFEDKPDLKTALVRGKVSINKLAKIASIATTQNQEELAGLARKLPCRALETLVRDEKQNGLLELKNEDKSVHVNVNPQQASLNVNSASDGGDAPFLPQLDADVREELNELQEKGIDISGLIREMLQKRREELAEEKQKLSEEVYSGKHGDKRSRRGILEKAICSPKGEACFRGNSPTAARVFRKPSRYIPAAIRHHLRKEHGNKCTIATCQKPATTIHHTQRFALSQNHDPNFLAHLCREHHVIAHFIDQKYQQKLHL